MAESQPSERDRRRWRREIVGHLEDFPRQYAALENAMAAFGDDFDLQRFKEAFVTADDMDAYNQVQSVERAVGRVQNYVAELSDAGAKLAGLPRAADGSRAERAFDALRDASVIDGALCRRLTRAQRARSAIEHTYVETNAGDVHRAAELVRESARSFIAAYRDWIEPQLEAGAR